MNTFAFNPTDKFGKQYANILHHIRKHEHLWDLVKVSGLMFGFVFCFLMYLYFVSMASTRGYFLKQAMQERTSISFQQEIVKTQILKIKQDSREAMKDVSIQGGRTKNIKAETIFLPAKDPADVPTS